MAKTYQAPDYGSYKMIYDQPHLAIEPLETEIAVVDAALDMLVSDGILPNRKYAADNFLAFRQAIAENFEIPWTAITPRMQRLVWAINAIVKPPVMLAAGIFCGNTFITNAGAAVGPGAVYHARDLIGVEIKPVEANRARRNVQKVDSSGTCRIIAEDAIETVNHYPHNINLLYLDADGDGDEKRGKGIYYDILMAAWNSLPKGAIILAHNSANAADKLKSYLEFVRNPANCKASVNILLDIEGLEVTRK